LGSDFNMNFRPCIDIHNGQVKQIVGSSLSDDFGAVRQNFVSNLDAAHYAALYKQAALHGGHVIILNSKQSEFYDASKRQALLALSQFPGGLSVGGGIDCSNAHSFLNAGAYAIIVTSFVFNNGAIDYDALKKLSALTGADRLILDLSAKKYPDGFHIMTNRWQKCSDTLLTVDLCFELSVYCREFLIHGVGVEGMNSGPDRRLLEMLSGYAALEGAKPVVYAGGIRNLDDIRCVAQYGAGRIDFTVGTALKLFGGSLDLDEILTAIKGL